MNNDSPQLGTYSWFLPTDTTPQLSYFQEQQRQPVQPMFGPSLGCGLFACQKQPVQSIFEPSLGCGLFTYQKPLIPFVIDRNIDPMNSFLIPTHETDIYKRMEKELEKMVKKPDTTMDSSMPSFTTTTPLTTWTQGILPTPKKMVEYFPSLDIIIGCMYAAKSTELLRRLTIFKAMGLKVALVNSSLDNRGENEEMGSLSTHNPTIGSIGQIDSYKCDCISSIMNSLLRYDVIGIDEGSLFKNLKDDVLALVEKYGKKVVVSGLNGDFQRKAFGELNDLVPFCDSIVKLSPYCRPCNEKGILRTAHFTKRKVAGNQTVLIGGKDCYDPVCRECFHC